MQVGYANGVLRTAHEVERSCCFFFSSRRRHTRLQGDWSSDVCSSDLASAPALMLALSTVVQVFENFAYHRQMASDDGLDVVLEFSASVGGKNLKGIDFIRFDEQGLIREFEVMVRPMSGLQALGTEMGKRLGDKLPAFKAVA